MNEKVHVTPGAQDIDVKKLIASWGIDIDPEMLILALTHRSFAHEFPGNAHNERLEFLGDAVLQLIVTEKLFLTYPDHLEGHLAKMRAATVSQSALASVARDIDLGRYILLGRGEILTGGRDKDSILSDTVEALIGATYVCHGLEPTRRVVETLVSSLLENALERGAGIDWKTTLQEVASALKLGTVSYQVEGTGPDHDRIFHAHAVISGKEYGQGSGSSKKNAERIAAHNAVQALKKHHNLEGLTTLQADNRL